MRTFDGSGEFIRADEIGIGDRVRLGSAYVVVADVANAGGRVSVRYVDERLETMPAETRVLRQVGSDREELA